jgi:uncharacterized protein YecE (DUF72 family)
MAVRIGVSGWSYDSWDGDFYPEDLAKKDRLAFIGERFDSVEINGSFYSLLRPDTYAGYHEQTPDHFVFAVKGSQFITHSKSLKDVRTPLANFLASGLLRLEDKLGPILWQLPDTANDPGRIEEFLEMLPKDAEGLARLAQRHDETVSGRASMQVEANHRVRHALELRNRDLLDADVVRLLRDHGVALVFSHSGDWPYVEELTAGFVYLRLHGAPDTYASGYGPDRLDGWADRIRSWARGEEPADPARITDRKPPERKSRDVYVYFDNDQNGYAPRDATRLMERVDGGPR